MVGVTPWVCELDEECGRRLEVLLVLGGKWTGTTGVTCVRAGLVLSPLQVAVAANMAALAEQRGQLVTRSLHTEILYNLSPSKNITQSLTKFGVDDQTTNFLVCRLIGSGDPDVDFTTQISGEVVPLDRLKEFTEFDQIKKVYKLSNLQCADDKQLLDSVISRIVTKNFVSH